MLFIVRKLIEKKRKKRLRRGASLLVCRLGTPFYVYWNNRLLFLMLTKVGVKSNPIRIETKIVLRRN